MTWPAWLTTPVAVFLAVSGGALLVVVLYDVWLWRLPAATISAGMAAVPKLVVFALGFAVGGVVAGLAVHFWEGQP